MKAYVYRLESVLRVRRLESALADQRVGKAALAARTAHDCVLDAIDAYTDGRPLTGIVDNDTFFSNAEHGARLALIVKEREATWQTLERELENVRDRAKNAARAVKLLEQVDERHRRAWLAKAQREDAAILDDTATTRAAIKLMKASRS